MVAGYYKGLPQNIFEKCLVPYVLVMPDKLMRIFYLDQINGYKKDIFIKFGGFNSKLDTSEDFEFANRLKSSGIEINAVPAVVGWMPRKNLKQAAWMFSSLPSPIFTLAYLGPKLNFGHSLLFILFLVFLYGQLFVLCYFIWSIWKNYRYVEDWRAIYWLPVLQLTADICVILGTTAGLLSKGSLGR